MSASNAELRIGIVGIGKIARDQHLPALAASPDFVLAATASHHATLDGVPGFPDIETMLAQGPPIDAVSICTPPSGRDRIARAAILAGKHVMIEKPPGATVSEVLALHRGADRMNVSLFASWHSREAAGVDAARAWLAHRSVIRVAITWREDIRKWHPGQEWILDAGGFGVFDPGINALSIVTAILPDDLVVEAADIHIPANRASPIAANVSMRMTDAPVRLDLDFLQTGPQTWAIDIETADGALSLTDGGKRLWFDGIEQSLADEAGEYARLYRRFADLVRIGRSDVDVRPLQLVADAFLLSQRHEAATFGF